MVMEPIKVEGLAQFSRALRKLDKDLPKVLRLAGNEAAGIVVAATQAKMPHRSGKATKSVKAKSTRTQARVTEGGNRAPYVPWLDFGGRVGRQHATKRPFIKTGRYLYPVFEEKRGEVLTALHRALLQACRDAGLEVS